MLVKHKLILSYILPIILFAASIFSFNVLQIQAIGWFALFAAIFGISILNPIKHLDKSVRRTTFGKISVTLVLFGLIGFVILVFARFFFSEYCSVLTFQIVFYGLIIPALLPVCIHEAIVKFKVAAKMDAEGQSIKVRS